MNAPVMLQSRQVARDTYSLPSYLSLPGAGMLPVNAFVIRGSEPVLVDTGLGALREGFLEALGAVLPPEDLRWIWITHTDADHVGNLAQVLDAAPSARVVTSFLGLGKLGLLGLHVDRVHLLNPGQTLEVGDRRLVAVAPPSYDAPETTGLFDRSTRVLFSADCFGALMSEPAETAADLKENDLRDGLVTWATVDAPWLHRIEPAAFARSLDAVRALRAEAVLSSHLPPAFGMTETLVSHLACAPGAQPFVGPDQAAFEQMMAAAAGS